MAIQFGTVDGLVNISDKSIYCFVKAIDQFISLGGPDFATKNKISYGAAFQRFVDPVYSGRTTLFLLNSILTPVYTQQGNEQSPARMTYCRKMGLLSVDEANDIFSITPLGKALLDGDINSKDYAFILLTKMGVFDNSKNYIGNLFCDISIYFQSNATISQSLLERYIFNAHPDPDNRTRKTRLDIILNALELAGFVTKVANDVYVISNTKYAELFSAFHEYSYLLSNALHDEDDNYSDYIGSLDHGIFDVLNTENENLFGQFFPNLLKYKKQRIIMNTRDHLQIIFYGAPGTGKSHEIKDRTKGHDIVRTTFHPDSDYSTFVGSYKPSPEERDVQVVPVVVNNGISLDQNNGTYKEEHITYTFVMQAFLKAYLGAWKKYAIAKANNAPVEPQFLIIEEINRGNCAQIFGDLFQLLDRAENGFSEYPIDADTDLRNAIKNAFDNDKDYKLGSHKIDAERMVEDYKSNYGATLSEDIQEGRVLLLPPNLYIWATMNTSDQSLFPIDSAFKRRWEWKYIKIKKGKDKNGNDLDWKIVIKDKSNNTVQIDGDDSMLWWDFLNKINEIIASMTSSADKQLGYFFCKADDNGEIGKDILVNKVIFYLWNDVFKDYGFEDPNLFKYEEGGETKDLTFPDFFDEDGENANETRLIDFLVKVKKWKKDSK